MGSKSQHTVSRMHLENFAGTQPAGQVWTYDCTYGRSWSQIPEETGTVTHFYSVTKQDGTQDTRIEEFLSANESRAAPIYRQLLRGEIPKKETQARINFAEFVAMMYFRTPGMRRLNAEIHSRGLQARSFAYAQHDVAFDRLIKGVETERGETMTPELKEQVRAMMKEPSAYEIEIPKHMTLGALDAADKLAPIVYNMTWSLVASVVWLLHIRRQPGRSDNRPQDAPPCSRRRRLHEQNSGAVIPTFHQLDVFHVVGRGRVAFRSR